VAVQESRLVPKPMRKHHEVLPVLLIRAQFSMSPTPMRVRQILIQTLLR